MEDQKASERYQSKVFLWYRSKHQALVDGLPFDEEKPMKSWSQFFSDTKEKTKDKAKRASFKVACLTHRADQRLLKSSTWGSMWKKLRGAQD